MYIGIDPGIRMIAWASLDDDGLLQDGGLDYNPSKSSHLNEKTFEVIQLFNKRICSYGSNRVAVEFTYSRFNIPSPHIAYLLAFISGAIYSKCDSCGWQCSPVGPSTWQKVKKKEGETAKEANWNYYSSLLTKKQMNAIMKVDEKLKEADRHNFRDAVCIAYWRYWLDHPLKNENETRSKKSSGRNSRKQLS